MLELLRTKNQMKTPEIFRARLHLVLK